jgi:hypothetical protein
MKTRKHIWAFILLFAAVPLYVKAADPGVLMYRFPLLLNMNGDSVRIGFSRYTNGHWYSRNITWQNLVAALQDTLDESPVCVDNITIGVNGNDEAYVKAKSLDSTQVDTSGIPLSCLSQEVLDLLGEGSPALSDQIDSLQAELDTAYAVIDTMRGIEDTLRIDLDAANDRIDSVSAPIRISTIPDSGWIGETVKGIAGDLLRAGKFAYVGADRKYEYARADVLSTAPAVGIVVRTAVENDSVTVLRHGYWRQDSAPNFPANGILYLSDTFSQATDTLPSVVDHFLQVVGVPADTNVIYFDPNFMTIRIQ